MSDDKSKPSVIDVIKQLEEVVYNKINNIYDYILNHAYKVSVSCWRSG